MKNLNIILVIAATAVIFCLSPAKAQVNSGTLLDSLSEEDELLDSNLVYKEMYEDSLLPALQYVAEQRVKQAEEGLEG